LIRPCGDGKLDLNFLDFGDFKLLVGCSPKKNKAKIVLLYFQHVPISWTDGIRTSGLASVGSTLAWVLFASS
jgi:hypothetical protein